MSTIKYSKLVRDRIPEIIKASGKTCVTEFLSDDEYLRMIDAKLDEELRMKHWNLSFLTVKMSRLELIGRTAMIKKKRLNC